MKEQFTQGDWEIDGRTVYALKDCLWQGKQYKENIFSFNVQGKCSGKELLANAVLAKAAPKMYRMLQEWVMHVDNGDTDHAIINEHVAIITRELLAEARGEK